MRHEINLLPPARRQRLRQQWLQETVVQVLRHVQVGLGVVTLIGVIAGVVLQGALVITPGDSDNEIPQVVRQYQAARQQITSQNHLAESIEKQSSARVVWSDRVAELLGVLPPNTTIEQLQATRTPAQLLLSGTSINRNSLVILQGRLEALSWTTQVDAPLQNLLDRDDPEYFFTLRLGPSGETQTPEP